MTDFDSYDERFMRRALELAVRGRGAVEPNPMVGCVIVRDGEIVGEGWHEQFGEAHAEVNALRRAGEAARGATCYVTLEPCCHHGKTPPCTTAIIQAGAARVVIGQADPFVEVNGGGLSELRAVGLQVETGLLEVEARKLNAPYLMLVEQQRPWVIAKWAMTLDGKIATHTGDSQWISNEKSRAVVHRIRGRVDAIIVGRGTVMADDPQLTARPPGPRTAARIVLASQAALPSELRLVQTASEIPVIVAASAASDPEQRMRLADAGCEMIVSDAESPAEQVRQLLAELGRRRMTNVLVEGGAGALGSFVEAGLIDEAHVFIAPKIIGGQTSPSPVGGAGVPWVADSLRLADLVIEPLNDDVYVHGMVRPPCQA